MEESFDVRCKMEESFDVRCKMEEGRGERLAVRVET
jgi:hypothetical protein